MNALLENSYPPPPDTKRTNFVKIEGMEINRTFTIEDKKDWQLLGEEMSSFYNKPMYSIINKFKKTKGIQFITEKYLEMEKAKDHNLSHLLQRLHH